MRACVCRQRLGAMMIKSTFGLTKEPFYRSDVALLPQQAEAMEMIKDENIDVLRSPTDHPLVTVGAHPLGMLMCLVVVQAEARRLRAAAAQTAAAKN